MINFRFYKNKKVVVLAAALLLALPSCELDEEVYSVYTPETFYTSETQVLSSLSGVYRNFAQISGMGVEYRTLELSADQVLTHGKIQGWWANNDFEQLMEHKWGPDHNYLNGTWNTFFQTVGQANALIAALDASKLEGVGGAKAELKALRAYAYFYLMDLFGNVPIFTEPKVDPNNLPEQNTRTEVFNFVVAELKEAAADLPSQTEVGGQYYGRLTKEAVYALLATVYLNAEVYTGTAQLDGAIEYADLVINSGAYILLPDYFDNFKHDNEENKEFIFGGIYTPNIPGGIGHPLVQKVLPGISGGLFGLPYTPQNGFGTRPSVVALYEDQDARKGMFMTPGELKDPRTGETVLVERIVPDNNSQLYKPGVSKGDPVPYVIIPATGIRNQPMNAGEKWIKWGLDPNTNGGNAGNDIAFIRYADVLLVKAEALARQGNFGAALPLINQIRTRSNASVLSSLTLNDVFEERGRELTFEMSRRRDLIRFGKFTNAWEFKEASEPFRVLYPIPSRAIDANPKLQQNAGY
ncbi:RagB/SusD family nutrient uptake outer membrane protein [Pontibacter sp. E15-1]|uniref:RagB/SusD family nutrient uptake outer membrane protein n=1 Tax=Pontibacter sp. E15-1 TaxID=2919918 RepID=UPI001F4F84AB|nr:RagB/SusD family nutrient uptake outer membrane protein [Pontibacter sp. E15-1]MCJ8165947.1 RagB/SusD family nutrient uptake outer membrane protein [Pontibacter sp. E15-1]